MSEVLILEGLATMMILWILGRIEQMYHKIKVCEARLNGVEDWQEEEDIEAEA